MKIIAFRWYCRAAKDPIRQSVQGVKNAFNFIVHLFTPSNIKHQLSVMQTMSIPELIVGFFKMIFYAFYYSGYGVTSIIRYLLINVLMSLMRGPAEEVVVEEPPVEEDRFAMKALAPLPSEETSTAMQALDTNKEENGQLKMAPHESTQSGPTASQEETGEGAQEQVDGAEQTAEVEQPMTLVRIAMIFSIFIFLIKMK